MNLYAKKIWVDALRSGNYVQICDSMVDCEADITKKSNKGMCVMGVLADVALRDSGLEINYKNWREFSSGNEEPTARTRNWAGLDSNKVFEMINDNDKKRKTFLEFADYIEQSL